MSTTPTIDYDALAAQHGGTAQIDYDALAAQHGGTVSGSSQAPDSRNWLQREVDKLTTVTPEQQQAPSWMPAPIANAVNQVQKFGAGAIQGATQPIVHPLDTLSGLGHAVVHPIDTGKALVQNAIANPAQTAGNLVGGAVAGEAAAPAAQLASKLAPAPIGRALLLGKTPPEAYESALKIPPAAMSQAERGAVVQTGLERGIPVSKGGLEKVGDLIDDYNQKIKDVIAADPTRPVNPAQAVQNLRNVRVKFATQVNPAADTQAVDSAGQEFLDQFRSQPGGAVRNMTADEAQAMKQGTYRALGDKAYGELKGSSIEAQKALARGLKEEIANQFPELNNLNAQESKLLDLQPVLERAVNRAGNHQLIGIGTPIAGAAVKAVTGSGKLGVVAGTLKGVLDNPFVKSRLAIAVSKGGNIPYAQAVARIGAYSSALDSASQTPAN